MVCDVYKMITALHPQHNVLPSCPRAAPALSQLLAIMVLFLLALQFFSSPDYILQPSIIREKEREKREIVHLPIFHNFSVTRLKIALSRAVM